MDEFITYDDVKVYSDDIADLSTEIDQVDLPDPEVDHSDPEVDHTDHDVIVNTGLSPDDYFTGVNDIVGALDPDAVQDDVYRDYGVAYAASDVDLPEYVVSYQVNGYDIYFPTEYAEDVLVVDGMLVNLGANYTVGTVLNGYNVSNYLSSEITIPTYHSSTWYQYLQNYGQPYRVVDRYVSNYGSISSYTRESVNLEFTGSSGWHGFTFSNSILLIIAIILFITFLFRKGR